MNKVDGAPAKRFDIDTALSCLATKQGEFEKLGISRIGVFGSVARGEETQGSDLDILLEFQTGGASFRNFMAVCDLLEAEFGPNIDVVTRKGLSPYIGPRILQETRYAPFKSEASSTHT